jgi:hypothetical protein
MKPSKPKPPLITETPITLPPIVIETPVHKNGALISICERGGQSALLRFFLLYHEIRGLPATWEETRKLLHLDAEEVRILRASVRKYCGWNATTTSTGAI